MEDILICHVDGVCTSEEEIVEDDQKGLHTDSEDEGLGGWAWSSYRVKSSILL